MADVQYKRLPTQDEFDSEPTEHSARIRHRSSTVNSTDLNKYRKTSSQSQRVDGVGILFVKKKWTRAQWMCIVTQCIFTFAAIVAYSLLSPFFPQEAKKKDVTSFITGVIFGFFELVVFIASPILGSWISYFGPNRMVIGGGLLSAVCSFTFGLLDLAPSGTPFICLCFFVRTFEAIGAAMIIVASYTLVAHHFPVDEVSSVNSYLEAVTGLGYMAGPPMGAWLYQAGGFKLPFIVVGFIFFLSTLFSYYILPPVKSIESRSQNYWSMLKIPGVIVIYIQIVGAGMALTYLDPTLSPFLENTFNMSMNMIGVIFLIWSAAYAFTAPIAGKLADKGYLYSMMLLGNVLCTGFYLLLGPSPIVAYFIPGKHLWLLIVSVIGLGISNSAMFIPPFQACLELALLNKLPDDMETYGIISGLYASANSMGAFIGPIVAGYYNETLGFEWSTALCAYCILVVTLILGVYVCLMKLTGRSYTYDWTKEDAETEDEKGLDFNANESVQQV